MSVNGLGPIRFDSVSLVTATPGDNDPEVGDKATVGGRDYLFVYNAGNSVIPTGHGAVLVAAATTYSCTVSSVSGEDMIIGVCRNASISTGYYGWLVTRGVTNVEMNATSGTVAAGQLLKCGVNGVFNALTIATGNLGGAIGQALEAVVSSASGSAYVRCWG